MYIKRLLMRVISKYRRTIPQHLYCRKVTLKTAKPIISFSFDDAPHTAFTHGIDIMKKYGARATFYVCLGLLDVDSPSGVIASEVDLHCALKEDHELGCHTFDHKNSWETKPECFVRSVLRNRQTLSTLFPAATFSSFAYPICDPRPSTKRRIGELFQCCRSGGQAINVGLADLNLLKAFFLDSRSENNVDVVKRLINQNSNVGGWLIFATHDVDDNPSRYGCSRMNFEEVVKCAANSGSLLLPVGKACKLAYQLTSIE